MLLKWTIFFIDVQRHRVLQSSLSCSLISAVLCEEKAHKPPYRTVIDFLLCLNHVLLTSSLIKRKVVLEIETVRRTVELWNSSTSEKCCWPERETSWMKRMLYSELQQRAFSSIQSWPVTEGLVWSITAELTSWSSVGTYCVTGFSVCPLNLTGVSSGIAKRLEEG